MQKRPLVSAAVGVTVAVGLVALPVRAGIGSSWTSEQQLWSTSSSTTQVATGTSGNGMKSTVIAAGKYSDWTGQSWAKGKKIPNATEMDNPDVQWDWKGKRTLLTWEGEANEGVPDLYRATRTNGGAWTTEMYGTGAGEAKLAVQDKLAVSAWYAMSADTGMTDAINVATWDGSWSTPENLATPLGDLPSGGTPRVAVDGLSGTAVVVWVQGAALRVSFWDGATWSPALTGAPGREPLAVTLTESGSAVIVTSRETAPLQQDIEVITTTAAGPLLPPATPVGTTTAASPLSVAADLSGDGTAGLVQYDDGTDFSAVVATWSATQPFTAKNWGDMNADSDLSDAGTSALTTLMPSPNASNGKKVQVSVWTGTSWSSPKQVGSCKDKQVAAGVSPGGWVMGAAWSCGHIHATRSPKVPGAIKGLTGKIKNGKATIKWDTAKNALNYGYKIKGPKFNNQWLTVDNPKVSGPVKKGATYKVSVRGQNAGGVGAVSSITLK